MLSKLLIQKILILILLLKQFQQSFYEIDTIQKDLKLHDSVERDNTKNRISLVEMENNKFVYAYINSNKKPSINCIKNGVSQLPNPINLTTSGEVTDIDIVMYDSDKFFVSYVVQDTNGGGSLRNRCYGQAIDIDGNVLVSEVDFLFNKECLYIKAVTVDSSHIFITVTVYEHTLGQQYDIGTFLYNIGVVGYIIQYAQDVLTGNAEWQTVIKLNNNKIIVAWQGEGIDEYVSTPIPIYYQEYDVLGNKQNDNKLLLGTQGNNLEHIEPILLKNPTNSSANNGFSITWTENSTNTPNVWFSSYDNNLDQVCIENITQGTVQTFAIYENIAYIIYSKKQFVNSVNKLITFGIEVNILNCYIERDPIQISQDTFLNKPKIIITKLLTDTAVAALIGSIDLNSSKEIRYFEYYLQQQVSCPDPNCVACYGTYTCPVCKGTILEERQIRTVTIQDCSCQIGHYNVINQTNCLRCMHQCKECDNGNECISCKNDEMLLPGCLYQKIGYYTYELSGIVSYGKCLNQCRICLQKENNCIECQGLNRVAQPQQGVCSCLSGYHDNHGIFTDCVKCNPLCNECYDDYFCKSCHSQHFREKNKFTGQCTCKRGYLEVENKLQCVKGYMIANGYLDKCPENTIIDEDKHICIYKQYDIESNSFLIVSIGCGLAFIELMLCYMVHCRIQGRFNRYYREYHENQVKLIEQRRQIYKYMKKVEFGNSMELSQIGSQSMSSYFGKTEHDLSTINLNKQLQQNKNEANQPVKKKRRQNQVGKSQKPQKQLQLSYQNQSNSNYELNGRDIIENLDNI